MANQIIWNSTTGLGRGFVGSVGSDVVATMEILFARIEPASSVQVCAFGKFFYYKDVETAKKNSGNDILEYLNKYVALLAVAPKTKTKPTPSVEEDY